MKRIYLAGPDVFFPDAGRHFEALKARCLGVGVLGVAPADGGLSSGLAATGDQIAERIYRANVALIQGADGLIANLMPFRNSIEADSGTVFELGLAVALGKPVAGFVPKRALTYETKVAAHCGLRRDAAGLAWDQAHGCLIEEFGQPMNLMLARSTPLFETFDEALRHIAARLAESF